MVPYLGWSLVPYVLILLQVHAPWVDSILIYGIPFARHHISSLERVWRGDLTHRGVQRHETSELQLQGESADTVHSHIKFEWVLSIKGIWD